jgi:hypothetical protein
MNIKAVAQAAVSASRVDANRQVSAKNTSAVSQAPRISAQASQFVAAVSESNRLSPQEKRGLIDVAAVVDQFINNPGGRQKAFRQLASFGVYLNSTSDSDGFPRWMVLTGLRYFGGVSSKLVGTDVVAEAQAVEDVTARLNTLAQQFRGTSLEEVEKALSQQPEKKVAQEVANFAGPLVEVVNEGVGASSTPQPTHVRDV